MNINMILILGTTASGKSRLAFDLARQIDAEIISIDSMKVYRRMDIGTAKPSAGARSRVNYHLVDVVEPSWPFNVATFLDLSNQAIEQIKSRNKPIIVVGGTAMYIKALLHGLFDGPGIDERIREELRRQVEEGALEALYQKLVQVDPSSAERIHPNDVKRVIRAMEVYELTGKPISTFQQQWNPNHSLPLNLQMPLGDMPFPWKIIGLRREKSVENSRINQRVKKMVARGLVDEVSSLLAEPKPLSKQARCAIGYAEIIDYLSGKLRLKDAIELIKKNTRRLAKHQRTWFKTFKNVSWLDIEPDENAQTILNRAKALCDI
ncbi:MAG: tRNA (adenosine(37)-N6)-dimethylallyltransferase MiaA [Planctomycetota bacterium]|jgi:tRNA dimethylallyltransferase